MKKRFTVMLEEETINLIKKASRHETPTGFRDSLEKNLIDFAEQMIYYYEKSLPL